jgi:hypothetical protein
LEYWNIGIKLEDYSPIFQHSNIPFFHSDECHLVKSLYQKMRDIELESGFIHLF